MAIRIIRTQRNGRESRLVVNDDGSVTHHVENFGRRLMRDGSGRRTRTMSANEAKFAWPYFARAIDAAVVEADRRQTHATDLHAATVWVVWQERLARLKAWSSRQRRDARAT